MKKIIILIVAIVLVQYSFGQNLIDIYKTGEVNLIPDKNYGVGNNWQNLFNGYYDKIGRKQVGDRKKIVVAPDGSVFMSHKNYHEIWKFNSQGKLSKRMGEQGGKPEQFPYLPSIQPIIGNKFYFTSDVHARLKFFDLDGNYVKIIKLDYMTNNIQPISDDKLLVAGSVLWKKGWREIISILDIESGDEKIIFSQFREIISSTFFKDVSDPKGKKIVHTFPNDDRVYMPNSNYFLKPKIVFSAKGDIIVANGKTGNVKVYNSLGSFVNEFKLSITPIEITENDVRENYEQALADSKSFIEKIRNSKQFSEEQDQTRLNKFESQDQERLERLKNISNYYPHLPYFTNIIFDDQNNLLVFEYTRKEEKLAGKFSVVAFNSKGEKLAQASFNCEDYNLKITESTFVFHNGHIIAICEEKNVDGIPLRLVRFKLQEATK